MYVDFVTIMLNMFLDFNKARRKKFRNMRSCTWTRIGKNGI